MSLGAYNRFRGQYCCHHEYLVNTILKGEWGFDGYHISDWAGAHTTDESARGGLDIEMGTSVAFDEYYLARPFREALESGELPPRTVVSGSPVEMPWFERAPAVVRCGTPAWKAATPWPRCSSARSIPRASCR